jgi:hypothetical protein
VASRKEADAIVARRPLPLPYLVFDCCTATSHPQQRLLLTNYDLGAPVPAKELQLGLDFDERAQESVPGDEMGEDAVRVLNQYISLNNQIRQDVELELPQVRAATKWVAHLLN